MKKSEIKVGGCYKAKVSGNIVTVRVNAIREVDSYSTGREKTLYDVTNLSTGRKTTFRSAMKFRAPVLETAKTVDHTERPKLKHGLVPELKRGGQHTLTTNVKTAEEEAADPRDGSGVEGPQDDREEGEQSSDPTAQSVVANGLAQSATKTEQPGPITAPTVVAFSAATPTTVVTTKAVGSGLAAKLARPAVVDNSPHVIVEARAGTGKTTTLITALKVLKGIDPGITPSPQQKAVWDAVAMSKGARTIGFCAFNKSIADELKSRVPAGCEAMTMHSLGFRAVRTLSKSAQVSEYRVNDIIAEIKGVDSRELVRRNPVLVKATKELVSLCKMNLCEGTPEELTDLVSHYEVDCNGSRPEVFELVPKVLERCKNVQKDNRIDFDDMVWLSVVLNLPVTQYDLLLVDEAQDLNRCQQALAKRAGKRLILCGDPKQAIYGFAGADSESMKRMEQELSDQFLTAEHVNTEGSVATMKKGRGCIVLPLTVTRRCGKAIVAEANKIVADFEAFETNPEGKIWQARYKDSERTIKETNLTFSYHQMVEDGDMILCRVNAPLVSQCFRFLKAGRKANIQGRDVGQGLITTLRKCAKKSNSVNPDLVTVVDVTRHLEDWLDEETRKENAKRNPSESRLIGLQDRIDCLNCFCDGMERVNEVIRKIESVFTDDKKSPGIRLSSIHKAKGLEARRVFLLEPEGSTVPHPMAKKAWAVEQEFNLRYVAITRAIEELVFVS